MTSPLEQLCTLLGTASSDNPQIRIPAEEQLKSFETAPSFYETLLVCLDSVCPWISQHFILTFTFFH